MFLFDRAYWIGSLWERVSIRQGDYKANKITQ